MAITEVQICRLLTLKSLVLLNERHYDHSRFKSADGECMCALGLSVEHSELFPDLDLVFHRPVLFGEDAPRVFEVLGYDLRTRDGDYPVDAAESYFGAGSWQAIFSNAYAPEKRTAEDVANAINAFIEKEGQL